MGDQLTLLADDEVFGLNAKLKSEWLLSRLNDLTRHHVENCQPYANLLKGMGYAQVAGSLGEVPFVHTRLFKLLELMSIDRNAVFKTLQSSGTTSSGKSKIFLDAHTARLQMKVLTQILQHFTGRQRRAMLIVDLPPVQGGETLSARNAGSNGLAFLGRNHCYAMNTDGEIDLDAVKSFFSSHRHEPILIFGFTFMLWQFVTTCRDNNLKESLNDAVFLHSGGWKKMLAQQVDNETFKMAVRTQFGADIKIHNFYGMAEQTGTVFVECEKSYLHAPAYAHIIVRDEQTFSELDENQQGLIQVLSALPESYPGHSILTEDLGTIYGEDDCLCGRKGRYFNVMGRQVVSEVRGCSDV